MQFSDDHAQEIDEYTLKTIALILCEPDLWAGHQFTEEEFADFQRILSDCLNSVERFPACAWMLGPLCDVLERVKQKHQLNFILRGIWI